MKKNLLMTAMILATTVALAACGGGGKSEGGSGEGKDGKMQITLSHQPYSHSLPSYIAEKEGMFEAAGLETKMLMFTSGPAQNEALAAGEWDVGAMGSPPSIMGGVAHNLHVIALSAPDTEAVTIWARPDSDVAQISGKVDGYPDIYGDADSWKGKTILCPTSTSAHFTLIATLEKMGLTDEDVEIINMDVPQAFTAFKAGQADIACLWDPQGFSAAEEDWVCISSGKATGEVMPTVVVASDKAIKEKPEEVLAWLDVYLQASEKYTDKLDEQSQLLYDFGKENGLELDLEIAKKSAEKRPLPTLNEEIELFSGEYGQREVDKQMGKVIDFFVSQGKIEETDKQALMDNTFIDGQFIDKLAEKYGKNK